MSSTLDIIEERRRRREVVAWTPLLFSKVVGWYRYDLGITTDVDPARSNATVLVSWANQYSGVGAWPAFTSVVAKAPYFEAGDTINSLGPVANARGNANLSLGSTSPITMAQPIWMCQVISLPASPPSVIIVGTQPRIRLNGLVNYYAQFNAGSDVTSSTAINNSVSVLETLFSGASSTLIRNGSLIASGNAGALGYSSATVGLLNYSGSTVGCGGAIAEFIVCSAAPSAEELTSLRAYTTALYGV